MLKKRLLNVLLLENMLQIMTRRREKHLRWWKQVFSKNISFPVDLNLMLVFNRDRYVFFQPTKATVAAASFSRNSKERHLSLAERKRNLIEAARHKYMEKHGMLWWDSQW